MSSFQGVLYKGVHFVFWPAVTAADSDMDKVGNSFLQLKMVLNKGSGTEEVFMGTGMNHQLRILHCLQ